MDKIIITGGVPLQGDVTVSGAKNSVLALMAACILADSPCLLHNVPIVSDVEHMLLVMKTLGVKANRYDNHSLMIDPTTLAGFEAPYDLVRKMRASIYVLGSLLGKVRKARVSMPGGCAIGLRPINLHLKGFQSLGCDIQIDSGYVNASGEGLRGAEVYLDFPSVGATVNVMLAAVLAPGKTLIENAALEPEIEDLANFLKKMGAKISGAGSSIIQIEGVKHLNGTDYTVIPDRIEAGTYIMAAAITGGKVKVRNAILDHMLAVQTKLLEAGVRITQDVGGLLVSVPNKLHASNITTSPYPGFPTDLQAQYMSLMCVSEGTSIIRENIWENRFMHCSELQRLGANIQIQEKSAIVTGCASLSGAPVMASDLRASAALALAGLVAQGETTISRVYHLDRGYEKLEEKLSSLGARIQRVKE